MLKLLANGLKKSPECIQLSKAQREIWEAGLNKAKIARCGLFGRKKLTGVPPANAKEIAIG